LPKKKKTHLGLYLVKMFKTNMEKEHTWKTKNVYEQTERPTTFLD
jgi:hypothetical protein